MYKIINKIIYKIIYLIFYLISNIEQTTQNFATHFSYFVEEIMNAKIF